MDNTIVHFEIPANNPEKLRKFYATLFGWKIERMPGPAEYYSIETVPVNEKGMLERSGVNGGLIKRQSPEHKTVNYIAVESVDEYAEKIVALGGKVIAPKIEVPGICWWALASDPEGNQFAIMQSI